MTSIVIGKDRISLLESERYVAGTKKVYTIKVAFSDDWEGLEKRVYFKTDKFEMSVAVLGCSETFPIPWEIFAQPSSKLQVGAYGCRCDQTVLNTRIASLGRIYRGSIDPCACGCTPSIPTKPSPGSFHELMALISTKADRLTFEDGMFILWAGEDPLSSFELPIDSSQLIPPGGETGQVLTKRSDVDGDVYWETARGSEPSAALKVPIGTIQMWHGNIEDIPESYSLCDGQNGTPDLRRAMIVGASESLEPGTVVDGPIVDMPMPIAKTKSSRSALPERDGIRYYALAFIQKTSLTEADQKEGKSAYEIAVANGYEGTEEEWLESLQGPSAYEIAQKRGFKGTEAEWLASLRGMPGTDGAPGKSAYQIAVEHGFEGSEEEWLLSIAPDGSIKTVTDKTITIKDELILNGTGSYFFDNVSIVSTDKTISFDKEVVYLDATAVNEAIITTLDNVQYAISFDSNGKVASIKEITPDVNRITDDEIDALFPWSGEGGGNGGSDNPGGTGSGKDGKSAYEIAVDNGFEGTEEEWLASLKGSTGLSAYQVAVENGFQGTEAEWVESLKGAKGDPGPEGKSAYETAIDNGFIGTDTDWLASLKGDPGPNGKSAYELAVDAGFKGTEHEWRMSLIGPSGEKGDPGIPGDDGASAYEIATKNGFAGTESEWLASLKGADGKSAYQIAVDNGYTGTEQDWLASVTTGADGKSAYQIAVDAGFIGTEAEWLASLKGQNGSNGESAYELAVNSGYTGTEAEWLASLKGDTGIEGKSAYDVAVDNGYKGSETEWLDSLHGKAVQTIQDYSTGETLVGRWIDNRPIYRRVIRATVTPATAVTVITVIPGIEPTIEISGSLEVQEDRWISVPGYYSGGMYGLGYNSVSGDIEFYASDTSTDTKSLRILLEYVKVGDDVLSDDQLVIDPGNAGGTSDHRQLTNRDASNQHPISAIDGLEDRLIAATDERITDDQINALFPWSGEGGDIPTTPTVGTNDHSKLINRNLAAQHPISAIDGLEDRLTSMKPDKITDDQINALFPWSGNGGSTPSITTNDHSLLVNRDLAGQHPISAITGLSDRLSATPSKAITDEQLNALFK